MATDCIVIADDSGEESDDESLPPFSQMDIGEISSSQTKRAYSGQEEVTPTKKTARARASPEHVYDLTASPSAISSSSRASSPSSNDHTQVEKRPLNSIDVDSRLDVKEFRHLLVAFIVDWSW